MAANGTDAAQPTVDEVLLDGVYDNLETIGYTGPLLNDDTLSTAIQQGLSSTLYKELVLQLCASLQQLCSLECRVSSPQVPEDLEAFQLELRSLLREMDCHHKSLMESVDVLGDYHKRLLLVDYLLSELMAARLVGQDEDMDTGQSGSIPASLSAILRVYEIKQPPANVTVKQIFDKIIGSTREAVSKAPPAHLLPSLLGQSLSAEQWDTLDKINISLTSEYEVRRKMLLTRCDVTVQSFRWSDRIKGKEEEFSRVYQSHRQQLSGSAPVSLSRVLAAKPDLLTVEKTNSAAVRENTQCSVNKVLIGKVPDRGGRPRETRPPPQMPAFKTRTTDSQDQRKGGGARGRGGSKGRVQGSWSQGKKGGAKGGSWQQDKGSHGNQQQGGGKQKQYFS
ncbi:protein FAM98A-like [Halichondria panicea]|uniref:protein FAM98A-like n=1 Tax=Halichondria panicea TaxID=6063 RepID=UPI00312B8D62